MSRHVIVTNTNVQLRLVEETKCEAYGQSSMEVIAVAIRFTLDVKCVASRPQSVPTPKLRTSQHRPHVVHCHHYPPLTGINFALSAWASIVAGIS